MKNICGLLFIGLMGQVFALINIGTTNLIYQNEVIESSALSTKSSVERGKDANLKVVNIIKQQLPNFQAQLDNVLLNSRVFIFFDGEPTLKTWQMVNPNILKVLLNKPVELPINRKIIKSESNPISNSVTANINASTTLSKSVAISTKKYILLGWVTKTTINEDREAIPNTSKTSLLYNLNIEVRYKVINQSTQEAVAEFIALGHAGTARILSDPNTNITYDTGILVTDVLSNLADDVAHELLLVRHQGVFDQTQPIKNAPAKP